MSGWSLNHDPSGAGPQYLEDLATGYWVSEVFFTAMEMDLFTLLEPVGKSAVQAAGELGCAPATFSRFLHALCAIGLLTTDGRIFVSTQPAREHLVRGRSGYLGDSILWRRYLQPNWRGLGDCLKAGGRTLYPTEEDPDALNGRTRRYLQAMDAVAKLKAAQIIPIFSQSLGEGELLDVGAGSGALAAAFLHHFPGLRATLMDLPHVLDCTRELMQEKGLNQGVTYLAANILEPWSPAPGRFQLVLLSNIIHAYDERETFEIMTKAAGCLAEDGFLLVHDFFPEHFPQRALLYDLNMLVNTYNGRIFPSDFVRDALTRLGLHPSNLIPLQTDTGLIIAARTETVLKRLNPDRNSQLFSRIRTLGFRQVLPIPAEIVQVADWVTLRCQFGCPFYGKPHCPPNAMPPQRTAEMLHAFSQALLLEGEPPTALFQRRVLQAEKEAFLSDYYKAFAFWAGPCSLCPSCEDSACRNPKDARPSMEAAGIDVFATVERAGLALRTLASKEAYAKHFALLLLE